MKITTICSGNVLRSVTVFALALLVGACGGGGATTESGAAAPAASTVIRITGSDTMVNLIQAWAENYGRLKPGVSVQVAGGGSGVGIAGLINGTLDIAASSRHIEEDEITRATAAAGAPPQGFTVGLDALAVYVHKDNPLRELAIEQLAEIYGDGGKLETWSQTGAANPGCGGDKIVRVSRQNNSGTYVYFREAVLGRTREFRLGSVDQSGSKDVVTLVSRTPCAIGYSGMAYAIPDVHTIAIAKKKGDKAILPTTATALDGTYPIARPLFLYSRGTPTGWVKEFIDWALGAEGQKIVEEIGFVPAPAVASK
jgi:phosphate transport system substrate-binding protein